MKQTKGVVCANEVGLRMQLDDSMLLQSLYFWVHFKTWITQKLVAA